MIRRTKTHQQAKLCQEIDQVNEELSVLSNFRLPGDPGKLVYRHSLAFLGKTGNAEIELGSQKHDGNYQIVNQITTQSKQ